MSTITYLVKLGELTLKASNKRSFEKRLMQNLRRSLQSKKGIQITLRAGRMYVEFEKEEPDTISPAVEFALNHLVGISGWGRTTVCKKNIDDISRAVKKEALEAKKMGAKSFKIESRRSDKQFELTSYDISRQAASPVFDEGILKVDVHNPDVTIRVEVREKCFVYSDGIKGHRGLPVGSSGKGLLLISGGIDSPVAGYRMMARGMHVDCIYFHAYPYTSDNARKKVEDLTAIIAPYGVRTHLHVVPFTKVQMRIKEISSTFNWPQQLHNSLHPEAYSTLLLRMCMVECANILAKQIKSDCLITGESLGQVASQTCENLAVTESIAKLPLFRPLIGLDKEEIVNTSKRIGTYETSILPYEDCCVLFSPKHPVLHARINDATLLYNALDCDELIQEAFDTRQTLLFSAQDYIAKNF
ncbi:MAG TPA: tRNA uracil 4-sulfurtransferase ThiI [Treponemataceae bacterium]|nr:tRNA uracil 4-sulfurtransferase ThiI [Treponemataceae bacterium]